LGQEAAEFGVGIGVEHGQDLVAAVEVLLDRGRLDAELVGMAAHRDASDPPFSSTSQVSGDDLVAAGHRRRNPSAVSRV